MEPKSTFPVNKYRTFWLSDDYLRATLATKDRFTARASDVLIATTSPSADITWLNSPMFPIMTNTGKNKNNDITSVEPHKLFPFLEGDDQYYSMDTYMGMDTYPSPRTFNNHIPYSLLPNSLKDFNCKIIYLCKETKDNFLSWWCYYKNEKKTVCETLSMEEAVGLYCSGMFPWGPVWEHMQEYWRDHQRRPERTLFLKYGDVKKDVPGTVLKLVEFMGWRELTGEKEKRRLVEGVADIMCRSLGSLEDGDWTGHLMPEMVQRMDKITQKKLHGSGLTF